MKITVSDREVMNSGEPTNISIEVSDDVDIYNLSMAFARLMLALGYNQENVEEIFGEDFNEV